MNNNNVNNNNNNNDDDNNNIYYLNVSYPITHTSLIRAPPASFQQANGFIVYLLFWLSVSDTTDTTDTTVVLVMTVAIVSALFDTLGAKRYRNVVSSLPARRGNGFNSKKFQGLTRWGNWFDSPRISLRNQWIFSDKLVGKFLYIQ